MQGAFKSCSYGNADFNREGVEVVSVAVPIPCKGSTPWNLPYDSSTCPYVGEYDGCMFSSSNISGLQQPQAQQHGAQGQQNWAV